MCLNFANKDWKFYPKHDTLLQVSLQGVNQIGSITNKDTEISNSPQRIDPLKGKSCKELDIIFVCR